jgi:hypothetical protein
MKTNVELFARLYAATHEAAANESRLLTQDDKLDPRTTRDDIAKINGLLRIAVGAALALESRLAGNPEPKEG